MFQDLSMGFAPGHNHCYQSKKNETTAYKTRQLKKADNSIMKLETFFSPNKNRPKIPPKLPFFRLVQT